MNRESKTQIRVLAIDPTHRGFAFAVLETPDRLIDWGLKSVRGNKNAGCLRKIRALIEQYQPTTVALENCEVRACRRCPRIRRLLRRIQALAKQSGVKTRFVSRAQVRKAFAPATTKHQTACLIIQRFPELAPFLPQPRKPWTPEDGRMHMFVAVALGLCAFQIKP